MGTPNASLLYPILEHAGRKELYADQWRDMSNTWPHGCIRAFDQTAALTLEYHDLLHGKWDHMLRQALLRIQRPGS